MVADAVNGGRKGRYMQGYEIGLLEDLIAVLHQMDVLRNVLCKRIKGDDFHVEAEVCLLGYQGADVAGADEAQGLAFQLALLDAHLREAVILHHVILDSLELLCAIQHVEDGDLCDRYGICAAGGADQDALLLAGFDVNHVISCAVAGHNLKLRSSLDDLSCNLGGADDHGVAVRDIGDDVILGESSAVHNLKSMVLQICIPLRKNRLGKKYFYAHDKSPF